MIWTCRRCDKSGEASEGVAMVFHRCTPPPGPRQPIGLEELFEELDRDLFDDRVALWQHMLRGMSP